MLGRKPMRPKRKQAAGIGIVLVFIAVCIPQHAPVIAQTAGSPKDILVIVNKNVATNSVNQEVVRDLFLKVRKSWGNGERALPINPNNDQLRNDFRKTVLNMNASAEERYWEDLKVKYGQSEPPVFSNNQKAVFRLPGSISYIYRKDYLSNVVKVVLVIPSVGN
jgi:hypothetical protein